MTVRVEHDDMMQAIPRLVAAGAVCDACVCDPPYHLTATQKRFGAANSAPAQYGRDGAMSRLSGGFMGQQWDGGDIAFRPETWATVATILRPGAFLVAFGGTRTYHRLACAIEDGGFVIQDCIMWLFATGFPKRRDMLKPAYEPIVLAYKPGGTRTMQVDECRVEGVVPSTTQGQAISAGVIYGNDQRTLRQLNGHNAGRWPSNVATDGSDEVLAAFPQSAGQQGDVRGSEPSATGDNGIYGHFDRVPFNKRVGEASAERRYTDAGSSDSAMLPGARRGDAGSAARFFFSAQPAPAPCDLCGWPRDGFTGTMAECNAPVSSAASTSSQPAINPKPPASVPGDVPGYLLLGDGDTSRASSAPASNAGSHSSPHHPTTPSSAPLPAEVWPLSKIVQNVESAAHLCGSCATAIAQSLAASRLGLAPELPPFPASISETSRQILTRSLVLYVAGRESTDTILTTPSLSELFGSVFHAIAENINSERNVGKVNIGSGQKRFHFSSKAQKSDRWGSRHPTIKPVELMKWLVKLVCPENGTLLDPFAGSGTTGVAALATGRNAILIEQQAAYVADIHARLDHYRGEGRHSLAVKNRSRGAQPAEDGDLFSCATKEDAA